MIRSLLPSVLAVLRPLTFHTRKLSSVKTDSLTLIRQARLALNELVVPDSDLEPLFELLDEIDRQIVVESDAAWEDGYRARDLESTREQW